MATYNEILQYRIDHGHFPNVKAKEKPDKYCKSNVGKVTAIEEGSIGVFFDGSFHKHWYRNSDSTDKRSKYIRDLEVYETKE